MWRKSVAMSPNQPLERMLKNVATVAQNYKHIVAIVLGAVQATAPLLLIIRRQAVYPTVSQRERK